MRRDILKELKQELEDMKAGKSQVEICPEKEAHLYRKPRRGSKSVVTSAVKADEKYLSVSVSRSAYAKLIRVARREKIEVSELIERLAKAQK